jgi:hypothetical protein
VVRESQHLMVRVGYVLISLIWVCRDQKKYCNTQIRLAQAYSRYPFATARHTPVRRPRALFSGNRAC